LADLIARFDPSLPLEHARTIPAAWYFDREIAELERRTVFAGWQAAARCDQVLGNGSFATADIAGEPVLVVRDDAGFLRAFHNVCRHRAAPLMTEPCGQVAKLRCRYHGWTYDLAGRLRGTPEFDGVCDFDRADNGLVPMTVAEWGPFVWVHDGMTASPLAEFLKPLPQMTEGAGMNRLRWSARKEYELACNWKVYVDNYLDGGYHVNTVHPELAGVLDYVQYRTELFANCSVQTSPLVPDERIGSVRSGTTASYWWVYPNLMLNLYDNVMDINLVLPLGPDRCRVIFDFYFAEQCEEFIQESISVADRVQQEDMLICEQVQRGLQSRSYDVGRFSVRREAGGYHFHRLLAAQLAGR